MTATTHGRRTTRIVIALNAPKHSFAALEIASALASRGDAELEALFVEEEELMHVAALPFAFEVDRVSGATRRLDARLMERVLRSEAAVLRRLLTRATASLPTSPKLRVVRGRYMTEALSVAATADVTILQRARRSRDEQRAGAPVRAPRGRRRKPVWVVYGEDPDSGRALEIAADLSRLLGAELVVMLLCRDEEQARSLEHSARARLVEVGADGRFVAVASSGTEDLRHAIGREGGDLLVLARAAAQLEDDTAAWLEETGIPVMLVA